MASPMSAPPAGVGKRDEWLRQKLERLVKVSADFPWKRALFALRVAGLTEREYVNWWKRVGVLESGGIADEAARRVSGRKQRSTLSRHFVASNPDKT